jgi:hypothetical protein
MTTVATIDFDAVYARITARLEAERVRRLRPAQIRLWDGAWILRGQVGPAFSASFTEIDLETGTAKLELPQDYYLARWAVDHDSRTTKNIHVTCDKDGVRYGARMERTEQELTADGQVITRILFRHDYEELKHVLCWSQPFLPAECQFPRIWLVFMNAISGLKLTLLVNIMRLESSIWMLPDDPLDPAEWWNFDQSTWSMVVKPSTGTDTSPLAVVHSRFKDFHTVAKKICEDGQLTPTFRRYLDGDDPPWEGADLRHGCLVIDIEDKSKWTSGTSFGGDFFTGLVRAFTNISSDGLTEGIDIIDDPAWPDEYYVPGWKSTLPEAPGIVYRQTEHNGILSSTFTTRPPTDVQVVTGGHSMPGVVVAPDVKTVGGHHDPIFQRIDQCLDTNGRRLDSHDDRGTADRGRGGRFVEAFVPRRAARVHGVEKPKSRNGFGLESLSRGLGRGCRSGLYPVRPGGAPCQALGNQGAIHARYFRGRRRTLADRPRWSREFLSR